jgi:hypothetical protein
MGSDYIYNREINKKSKLQGLNIMKRLDRYYFIYSESKFCCVRETYEDSTAETSFSSPKEIDLLSHKQVVDIFEWHKSFYFICEDEIYSVSKNSLFDLFCVSPKANKQEKILTRIFNAFVELPVVEDTKMQLKLAR